MLIGAIQQRHRRRGLQIFLAIWPFLDGLDFRLGNRGRDLAHAGHDKRMPSIGLLKVRCAVILPDGAAEFPRLHTEHPRPAGIVR